VKGWCSSRSGSWMKARRQNADEMNVGKFIQDVMHQARTLSVYNWAQRDAPVAMLKKQARAEAETL
jgi:hypothetical protein